jgi:sulfur-oxidizing protein SoxZ
MLQAMKIRASARGEYTEIKVLIQHEMETGLRKDERTGEMIPAHFLQLVEARHNGKTILSMQWGVAISQNPYLGFRIQNTKPGDVIMIEALDNRGETYHGELVLS